MPEGVAIGFPSYSIIIETENLSLADNRCLWRCLDSISQSIEQCGQPPVAVYVVNSGDLSQDAVAKLAADYRLITLLIAPAGANYYESKMHGVGQSTSEIIVFADSDCTYNAAWLAGLLEPFNDQRVNIVAGETRFVGRAPYALAMNIIHSFDGFSGAGDLRPVNNYYANNLAVRRHLLIDVPIPTHLPLYRHGCSWHSVLLRRKGEVIWSQPRSRAEHATPEGFAHFYWRFLLFGRDRAVRARLGLIDNAPQTEKPAGGVFGVALMRLRRALRQDPVQAVWLPVSFLIVVAASLLIRAGKVIGASRPELAIAHFGAIEGVRYPSISEYLKNLNAAGERCDGTG